MPKYKAKSSFRKIKIQPIESKAIKIKKRSK